MEVVSTSNLVSSENKKTTTACNFQTMASDDYGFANRWIVFILLNEKTFFTIY